MIVINGKNSELHEMPHAVELNLIDLQFKKLNFPHYSKLLEETDILMEIKNNLDQHEGEVISNRTGYKVKDANSKLIGIDWIDELLEFKWLKKIKTMVFTIIIMSLVLSTIVIIIIVINKLRGSRRVTIRVNRNNERVSAPEYRYIPNAENLIMEALLDSRKE